MTSIPPLLFFRRLGRRRSLARWLVLPGVAALVALPALSGAAAVAAPLPKGAYWYQQLDLVNAWKITQGAGVTVAVVDSGVKAAVGDLKGQVLPGLDLSGTNPSARNDTPLPGEGGFGHGTDMAVLIAGTGKGGGLKGVAPQAKILPVDAKDASGKLTDANIAEGIRWSVDHGATVVNLSVGGLGACTELQPALTYAYRHDVLVVAASGDGTASVVVPAACPGAIAVGAVNENFTPWFKSASGPDVAFVAPGSDLVDELLDGTVSGPDPGNAGTSQATAMVSGTFALLRAHFPHESARQLVTRALYNVHNGLGAGHQGVRANNSIGFGLVLPRRALTTTPPAGAANPIYDAFARALGNSTPSSSSPAGSPSAAPVSGASSDPATSSTPVPTAGGSSSSGPSAILIVVIVVVVVGLGLVALLVVRRRNAPSGPAGYPPAPPGYGR